MCKPRQVRCVICRINKASASKKSTCKQCRDSKLIQSKNHQKHFLYWIVQTLTRNETPFIELLPQTEKEFIELVRLHLYKQQAVKYIYDSCEVTKDRELQLDAAHLFPAKGANQKDNRLGVLRANNLVLMPNKLNKSLGQSVIVNDESLYIIKPARRKSIADYAEGELLAKVIKHFRNICITDSADKLYEVLESEVLSQSIAYDEDLLQWITESNRATLNKHSIVLDIEPEEWRLDLGFEYQKEDNFCNSPLKNKPKSSLENVDNVDLNIGYNNLFNTIYNKASDPDFTYEN